jgi:ABC-type multidrug transport system ATPase subunit
VSETAIEVDDLVKVYPGGTTAVSGMSFQIGRGEIFGLLGPNGSGKTTTVRILATLLHRTSGTARVCGFDPQVRNKIGYAGQFIGVDDDLTARENLLLQGRLHGLTAAEAATRANELFDIMSLTKNADMRTVRFSGGMRRRVDLIQALVHRPTVLFLDEPTTGMDPQSRMALWEYLHKLKRDGMTILLTTQYLEEADRACDRIAIISEGKLVKTGSPRMLKGELGADRVTLTLSSPLTDDPYDRAAQLMTGCAAVTQVEQVEPLVLSVHQTDGALPQIIRQIEADGIQVNAIRAAAVTLDDVFLKYTGRKVRKEVISLSAAANAKFAAMHGGRLPR